MSVNELPKSLSINCEEAATQIMENHRFVELLESFNDSDTSLYYGSVNSLEKNEDSTDAVMDFIFATCGQTQIREELDRRDALTVETKMIEYDADDSTKVVEMDRRLMRAFRDYKGRLPLSIWSCCSRGFFASLVADCDEFLVFDEVFQIHEIAKSYHEQIGDVTDLVETRRRGIGGSSVVFVSSSRSVRETNRCTDRQRAVEKLAEFISSVLPFLYGVSSSPTGVRKPKRKCVLRQYAICSGCQGTSCIDESVYQQCHELTRMK